MSFFPSTILIIIIIIIIIIIVIIVIITITIIIIIITAVVFFRNVDISVATFRIWLYYWGIGW